MITDRGPGRARVPTIPEGLGRRLPPGAIPSRGRGTCCIITTIISGTIVSSSIM